jgi:drug/metabolite transporter (DMT)-like permease
LSFTKACTLKIKVIALSSVQISQAMKNPVKNTHVYPALFTGLLLIGLSPILIKLAGAPGIITSFYRMFIGGIILTPIFLITLYRTKTKLPSKGILFATLGGVCLGTDMAFWTTGIMASNATLPTLVGNLAPLWVGISATFIFKEKQNIGFWAGVFLAITGIGILMAKDIMQPGATLKGIVLGLLAGIFYAGYQMFTQPGRKLLNTISYLYISTLATALTTAIYALIFQLEFTGYSNETWLYWIAMGIGIQVFGWFFINYSQGYLPASVVSPTLLGQPILTAIIAVFLLTERFTVWHIIGAIVIISGIYVVHFTRSK